MEFIRIRLLFPKEVVTMLNSDAIKKFVLDRRNSLFENIALCVAITLTSAFFSYDTYYFFLDFLRPVVSVLLMFIWLWCGFKSGIHKKWGFLAFTAAYWLVPYLYMLYFSSRDNIKDYNAVLTMLYKFSNLIYKKSMTGIAEFTHCGVNIWVLSLAILTFTLYYAGMNVSYILKAKEEKEEAEKEEAETKAD